MNDIRIKRVYDPPVPDDGARILVDRLWPRGLGRDSAALTLWLQDVAPSAALRRWFGHDPGRWEEFRDRYRRELESNASAVGRLAAFLRDGPVTLLFAARDERHNHARVLAEFMAGEATERMTAP
ncbi:MAG: DUF488 domain-containing protein [Telmatospirillum sp.]|nr:DUF488 domain-containing protein [Telmatospirillum sp.]